MSIKTKKILYQGFHTLYQLQIEEEGSSFERELFEMGKAAAALVYHTQKKMYLLVKQYRYGAGQELLEIPAGLVEKDNDPEKTVRKEVEEETGYAIDHLRPLMSFYSSPGTCTEEVFLYYAEVSRKKSEGGGLDEENENIRIQALRREELLALKTADAKTIIAIQWLHLHGLPQQGLPQQAANTEG